MGRHKIEWSQKELLQDAKSFKTRTDWTRSSPTAVKAAKAIGKRFYEKCCSHMKTLKQTWTKAGLAAEAKKFRSKGEWQVKSPASYVGACNGKFGKRFFEKICSHMEQKRLPNGERKKVLKTAQPLKAKVKPRAHWDRKTILKEARRFKTRGEWFTKSASSYVISKQRYGKRFFDYCVRHMK